MAWAHGETGYTLIMQLFHKREHSPPSRPHRSVRERPGAPEQGRRGPALLVGLNTALIWPPQLSAVWFHWGPISDRTVTAGFTLWISAEGIRVGGFLLLCSSEWGQEPCPEPPGVQMLRKQEAGLQSAHSGHSGAWTQGCAPWLTCTRAQRSLRGPCSMQNRAN